ncbi:MAG TPA: hypothetical protein VEW48_19305 [Thermoanaerobaculia bacterium]|nr:hypothetical protein [Thermoanaerobaculia bacterium]
MESRGERLRTLARGLWRWLFPEEVELPEEARRALAVLYPSLDLARVRFHLGLPHLLRNVATGMTLPGVLSSRLCRIYVQPWSWRPETPDGLDLLAHEAFHALQMQEGGPGLGLVRPFIVLYLACAAGNDFRYSSHPLEVDAYRVAGRSVLSAREEGAVETSGLAFWRRLAASAPGGALGAPFWLVAWTGATAVLWIAWLVTVGAGALAVGVIWLAGAVLAWMERIFRE